jgi:signal transduction histidine kinase
MALSNLARSVADRNHFVLDLSLPNEIKGWSPEIEHTYYRITEEGLRNVAQHSGAQKIAVSLRENSNHLSLTVHDDGRGFDPKHTDPEQRFGLQGMRERAESIGAHFTIKTAPSQGTTIQVEVENHI